MVCEKLKAVRPVPPGGGAQKTQLKKKQLVKDAIKKGKQFAVGGLGGTPVKKGPGQGRACGEDRAETEARGGGKVAAARCRMFQMQMGPLCLR